MLINERSQDIKYTNHSSPVAPVQFLGRFDNRIDPVSGFAADFDYFQLNLTGAKKGTKITLKFDPEEAYFFSVTARFDEQEKLYSTSTYLGSNATSVNGPGTYTWTVPDLSRFSQPVIEFELKGGGPPSGAYTYTPLNYTVDVDSNLVEYNSTANRAEKFVFYFSALRLKVLAGPNDDYIGAGEAEIIVFGGDGRDVVLGSNRGSTIYGDNGDPTKGGADQLSGGIRSDKMWGNGGNDYIGGGASDDEMHGENGNDVMYGDHGADRLFGDRHDDVIYGSAPKQPDVGFGKIVVNWDGIKNKPLKAESLSFPVGNYRFDMSDDRLEGGKGNDKLYGQGGNDILKGGDGNDRLTGGYGRDFMTGGLGADIFDVFVWYDELYLDNDDYTEEIFANRDKITDFEHHLDKIDLSSIDANLTKPGNQAFVFIGSKPFQGKPGEVRWDGKAVHADTDGGKVDDWAFDVVLKTGPLDASDFIL